MTAPIRASAGAHPEAGFTMLEMVLAMFITALVLLAAWAMFGAAGDQQLSGWREADRRSEAFAAERVLAAAIGAAGTGMPSSPNLGGVHVRTAGAAADTLYVFEGSGPRLRVASRTCAAPGVTCVLVLGAHRGELHAGATVILGTGAAGLRVMRIAEAPTAFSAACGPDCVERILCAITPADPSAAPAVAGSVVLPPGPPVPVPSSEPCVQPVFPDGTSCTENEAPMAVTPLSPERCTATGPASAFTEVHLVDAGTSWGLPVSQAAPAGLGGALGTPAPLLQEVRVARFWVRTDDSTLVKQTAPTPSGWTSTQPVAAHVVAMTLELRHAGSAAWTRGLAMPDWFLHHAAYNPNFVRSVAPADSAPPAWRFRVGYHTVAAVRVTITSLRPDGADGWSADPRRITVATPAVTGGARADGGS
jgi:hypothetical protein